MSAPPDAARSASHDARPPRRYREDASWFHLLTHPDDYAEEASAILDILTEACGRRPRTLLELGSGGGNNASHLKHHVQCTLVDVSPDMLALSRELNPECEHLEGDMRAVRLGRTFDAVLVHDACCYLVTESELDQLAATCAAHLKAGGAALLCPDHVAETFEARTSQGGHDGADGRSLRYLSWQWDPDPTDSRYVMAMTCLLREADGSVRSTLDLHDYGLFPRARWLTALSRAALTPHPLRDSWQRDVFVGGRESN